MNSERAKKAIKEVCKEIAQMTPEHLRREIETTPCFFQNLPDNIKLAICKSAGSFEKLLKNN